MEPERNNSENQKISPNNSVNAEVSSRIFRESRPFAKSLLTIFTDIEKRIGESGLETATVNEAETQTVNGKPVDSNLIVLQFSGTKKGLSNFWHVISMFPELPTSVRSGKRPLREKEIEEVERAIQEGLASI